MTEVVSGKMNGGRGAIVVALPKRVAESGFGPRDRHTLNAWASAGRRVVVTADEIGVYAMLYDSSVPWASWGLVRQDREILLWDCVTLADVGRFATVEAALAAASGEVAAEQAPKLALASIIPFAAAAARRRGLRV